MVMNGMPSARRQLMNGFPKDMVEQEKDGG